MMATDKKALQITILTLEKAKLKADVVALQKQLAFALPILADKNCPQEYGASMDCTVHDLCIDCWKAVLKEVK